MKHGRLLRFSSCKVLLLLVVLFVGGCKNKPEPQPEKPAGGDETYVHIPTNTPAVQLHGQLSVKGNRIVNKDDKAVALRGMSFYWSQWSPGAKYYNAATVKWLRDDWRCNIVRAAVGINDNPDGWSDGYLIDPETEKTKLFAVIDAAIANDIYVIVDWHDHHANDHLVDAKAFFSEVAQKYGQYPHIIYEPWNEPLAVSWANVCKPYHEEIIAAIRAHDPDNIIVCGTPSYSQDVDIASNDPLSDPNVAYTLHYYAGTHKQNYRDKASIALNRGAAIFVTEYGTVNANGGGAVNGAESQLWWDFLDKNLISACNWSICDKAEGSAALVSGASTAGGWTEDKITVSGKLVRDYLISKNPVPAE